MRNNLIPTHTFQSISFNATSAQSSALAADTRVVSVAATQHCYLAFGANPTADSSGFYLPANTVMFLSVEPSTKIAALRATANDGVLSISEGRV